MTYPIKAILLTIETAMTSSHLNNEQTNRRLHQLIAEIDGTSPSNTRDSISTAEAHVEKLLSRFLRWSCFGLLSLGLGFWGGSENARLRWSLRQPSDVQLLSVQGWRHDGTGVFYRWCQESCHSPRIYGGGVIKAFDVKCVDRPCGDILMRFNVRNTKGEVIDQLAFKEAGLQGETRRFLIESQNPDAASLELSEFTARAKDQG